MIAVGIRELKNRLSHYLRLVEGGEAIQVTNRGTIVAELRPPGQASLDRSDPRIEALLRLGDMTIGEPNRSARYEVQPSRAPAGTARKLLDEERGER
jgi:antitoxin (DNA-binding transcriptional repressor) of toxin-antitoxin stability system